MLYNKLPLYKMVLDDGEDLGVSKISLVEFPAVEEDFLLFENKELKEYKFEVQDEEKHIVSGIVMVADRPIYREDSYGKGYYVVFPKETIEELAFRFAKNKYIFNISIDHMYDVDNCYVCESFIINKERGICPVEFSDVEDGSWFASVKIENEDLWNAIKNGEGYNGFSVEVKTLVEEFSKQNEKVPENWLKTIFAGKIFTK